MKTVTLYKIIRPDGGITVTPIEQEKYESIMYRLIADEGMELVKGDIRTSCIDTDNTDGWKEENNAVLN